jgi:hypothetical protein
MARRCINGFLVLMFLAGSAARGDLIEVDGIVKGVNVEERTLTLARKRGTTEKVIELEVSKDADLRTGTATDALGDIKEGDRVTVTYDPKLEIVTALTRDNRQGEPPNYTKLLRKKFAASQATFDHKTGLLTLGYDFSKSTQAKDFRFGEGALTISGRTAKVSPLESVVHTAVFRTGSVQGNFLYGNDAGEQIMLATTSATSLRFHKNGDHFWFQLFSEGHELSRKTFEKQMPIPIRFEVTESKVQLKVKGQELAGPRATAGNCGAFALHGGNAGLAVTGLVISGIPDDAWMKSFFESDK